MSLLNLSKEYQASAEAKLRDLYGDPSYVFEFRFREQYSLPYKFKPDAQKVLIVGAGAGNDAAGAVRVKIPQIEAVEIDPTIIDIGKKFHYEKPYSKPNVKTIVDDGRSFFERTNEKYDIVVMGLADSHTLSSSLTNLRLDHYLYTKESLERVRDILSDNGMLFLTFEVPRPWIGGRIQESVTEAFGQEPVVFENRSQGVFGWGGFSFVVSKNPQILKNILANNKDLAAFVNNNRRDFKANINPLTDDWPYLYLDKPRLPLIHLLIAGILSLGLLFLKRPILGKKKIDWPMFLWGAAFLLFEFQNISKTSLLFGLTWVTNIFTISAILILLLLANFTVSKKWISPKTAFFLLMISLVVEIAIPLHILNSWNMVTKITLGSLILNLPVYFGGIIFTSLFARARDKANAFGSNFIGSVFGGFGEMISFLTGIHFLLFVVLALYLLGFTLSSYLKFPFLVTRE